jgi:ubiquinone/menaquinone biosynthesis methyltransferase
MIASPGLRAALDSPDAKRRYVRTLFATIADRYDLITVLLSFGLDSHWKKRLVAMAELESGVRALDLACGTGDIAFALARRGASVTGLDITPGMIALARLRQASGEGAGVRFLVGDMMSLPFPDETFDVVTTGYGLRNVPGLATSVDEIRRVLKRGGQLLSLDFNRPRQPLVRFVYLAYLTIVGGTLGFLLHRDPDTYRYLPESIRRYPGASAVAALLRQRGYASASWRRVLGGLMAIHAARK